MGVLKIQAINSKVMKMVNRKMVLERIRRRPISRAELAIETSLTRASVTQIVDGLMEEGLVVEANTIDRHTPGRKQTSLELVKDSLCIAGIYCGRTSYRMGIMNLDGTVLWSGEGTFENKDHFMIMNEAADQLRSAFEALSCKPAKVYGLGICMPSPVEQRSAINLRTPEMVQQRKTFFKEEMEKRLGWDVYVGSVSNAHALDELYFGIGRKGVENFMVLRVDESVGAGFIINNRLFRGARGFSPEIGHITLERNGPLCICGNRGCLELYLATPHVLKDTDFKKWSDVIAALNDNPAAMKIYQAETETLAFEIMNLANVMDLDKVVITGDLVCGGDRLCENIMEFMNKEFVHRLNENSVVPSEEVNIARISCMPAYHSIFA